MIGSDLHRRGCTRTAFEFAKVLYSLDPWTDPHGSLLHLDGLAIQAGMHGWMLDTWEYFETNKDGLEGRLTPTVLPGWWYTRALAMKIHEDAAGLQASEITHLVPHSVDISRVPGQHNEHPGVRRCSTTISFPSSAARRQDGHCTICGDSIQAHFQSTR